MIVKRIPCPRACVSSVKGALQRCAQDGETLGSQGMPGECEELVAS